MDSIKDFLISFIFPERCPFCDMAIDYKSIFCDECAKEFLWTSKHSVCQRCGKIECVCGKEPFLDRIYVPLFYEDNVKTAVKNFKFNGKKGYSRPLAKLISAFIVKENPEYDFDVIIPVPMTKKDIRKRGYNQSILLAKFIGENLGIETDFTSLVKIKQTEKQHNLKGEENRLKNLKGAFSVTGDLKGKKVLICDDVITTGSTLREVASVLRKAGVKNLSAAVIATVSGVENS